MKSIHRTPQTTPMPVGQSASPQRRIALTAEQSARWLKYLERNGAESQHWPTCLTQLCKVLSDATWLARWQREATLLETCPTEVAEIFSELLKLSQHDQTKQDFDVLEEMIVTLCIDQHSAG